VRSNFREVGDAVKKSFLWKESGVDGVLMDLGVSSHQIDQGTRGFSYGKEGPLDMRMNRDLTNSLTAWHIINEWDGEDIANVIFQFGEERKSRQIAREIVTSRPIQSTLELSKVIERITPSVSRTATLARCFQALRIAVNDELTALDVALNNVHAIVKPGGRFVVLSYHSLEDRRVKLAFRKTDLLSNSKFWKPLEKDIITATEEEISKNSRSRSAKLRVACKL
jgi:16S rRNA (cytosine1402-N4)-methyltransferase